MRYVCILVLFSCNLQFLLAQVLPYRQYNTNNGLPHSNVYCITQDAHGFIWMGTEKGLVRFDGKEFISYPLQKTGANCEITSLALSGNKERIWVGVYDGALNYIEKGLIYPYTFRRKISASLPCLFEQKNTLYSFTVKGITVIQNGLVQNKPIPDSIGRIHRILPLRGDSILLGADSGCYVMCGGNVHLLWKLPLIRSLSYDQEGFLWMSTNGKIIQTDKTLRRIIREIEVAPDYIIENVLHDSRGRTWYNYISAYGKNRFVMYDHGREYEVGQYLEINGTQINSLFEDGQQNVWISTYGKGVYCLYSSGILNFTTREGLNNNFIFSIARNEEGHILAGSYHGLNVLDASKKLVLRDWSAQFPARIYKDLFLKKGRQVFASGSTYSKAMLNSFKAGQFTLHYCNTKSILPWGDTLLVAGWGKYIEYYVQQQGKYRLKGHWTLPVSGIGYLRFNRLYNDQAGHVWVGSSRGLFLIQNTRTVRQVLDASYYIHDIKQSPDTRLWIASEQGVFFQKKNHWYKFKVDNDSFPFSSSLVFDKKGNLWIGNSKGLYFYNGKSLSHITHQNGLLSDNISALYYDESTDELWIGSSEGLSCLQTHEYFGEQQIKYAVQIQKISAGQSTFVPVPGHSPIHIPYGQRDIRIYFSEPEFKNPEGLNFQYWFSDDPLRRYSTKNPFIQFASAEPGLYTLYIGTGPAASAASLSFEIDRPFWMKWPFIILVVLLCTLLIWGGIQIRISQVKRQEQQKRFILEEMNRLKYQALVANINPHFVFNGLSTVQSFVNDNKAYEATEYLAGFGKLLRLNLDVANASTISLSDELERLRHYLFLEKLRFGEKLNYTLQLEPNIEPDRIAVPNMMLQPLAENAIKHGILPGTRKGLLEIKVYFDQEQHLCFSITDNGIGLAKAAERKRDHIPRGIKLVEERLQLLLREQYVPLVLEEISDQQGKSTGTRVLLKLPILPFP